MSDPLTSLLQSLHEGEEIEQAGSLEESVLVGDNLREVAFGAPGGDHVLHEAEEEGVEGGLVTLTPRAGVGSRTATAAATGEGGLQSGFERGVDVGVGAEV